MNGGGKPPAETQTRKIMERRYMFVHTLEEAEFNNVVCPAPDEPERGVASADGDSLQGGTGITANRSSWCCEARAGDSYRELRATELPRCTMQSSRPSLPYIISVMCHEVSLAWTRG